MIHRVYVEKLLMMLNVWYSYIKLCTLGLEINYESVVQQYPSLGSFQLTRSGSSLVIMITACKERIRLYLLKIFPITILSDIHIQLLWKFTLISNLEHLIMSTISASFQCLGFTQEIRWPKDGFHIWTIFPYCILYE